MAKLNLKNGNVWWKHWFLIEVYKAAAVFLGVIIVISILLKIITRHNSELEVPDFSGLTVEAAADLADDNNLQVEVTDSVFMPKMARGSVFRQNPHPGAKVKKNRRILLTINSIEAKKVKMPSVTGFSLRQAKAELATKHLRVGKLIYVRDMATNNVLSQRINGRYVAPGSMVESDSEIDLEVGLSSDGENTLVPDVSGLALITAKDILIDNSLNIGKLHYDESVKNISDSMSCFVIKQQPEPSEYKSWALGTRVDLYLSVDKTKLETKKKSE